MLLQKVLLLVYAVLSSENTFKSDSITQDTYFYLFLKRILFLESKIEESDKNNYEGNSLFKKQLNHNGNSKFFLNSNFILNDSEIKKILPFIKIQTIKNMCKSLNPFSLNNEKFDSIISVNEENLIESSRKKLLEKINSLKQKIEKKYNRNFLFLHRVKQVKEKKSFNPKNYISSEEKKLKKDSLKEISSESHSFEISSNSSRKSSPSFNSEINETLDFEKNNDYYENPEEKIKNSFKENKLENLSSISDNESDESFVNSLKNFFNSENENLSEVNQEKKDTIKEISSESHNLEIVSNPSKNGSLSDSLKYSSSVEIVDGSSSLGSSEKTKQENVDHLNLHETVRKENPRLKRSLTSKYLSSSKDQEELFKMKKLKNSSKSLYENYSDDNSNSFKAEKSKNNNLNPDNTKDNKESDLSSINNLSIKTKNRSNENFMPSKKSENLDLSRDKEIIKNDLVRIQNENLSSVNEHISKANTSLNNEEKPLPAEKSEKGEKNIFVQDEKPEDTDQPECNTPDKIDELNDSGKQTFIEPEHLLGQDDKLSYSGKQTFVQEDSDTPGQINHTDYTKKQYFVLNEFNTSGPAEKSENQGKITLAQPKLDTPEQTNQLTNKGKQIFVQQDLNKPEEAKDSKNLGEETSVEPMVPSKIAQKLMNFGKQRKSQFDVESKITKQSENQREQISFQPVVKSSPAQQLKNLGEQRNCKPDVESKLAEEPIGKDKVIFVQPEDKEKKNQNKTKKSSKLPEFDENLISESNKTRDDVSNILRTKEMKKQNNLVNIEIPKKNIKRPRIEKPEQPITNAKPEPSQLNIINTKNLVKNPIKNRNRISLSQIKGNNSVPLNLKKEKSSSVPKKASGKEENPKKDPSKSKVRSSSGNPDNDPHKNNSSESLKDSKKKKNNEPQGKKEKIKPNKRVTLNFDKPIVIESPKSSKDTDKRSNLSKGSGNKQEIIAQPEEDLRQGSKNEDNSDGIAGNIPKSDSENKWKWWHTVVAVVGGSVLLVVGYFYVTGKNEGVLR